jgi:hypothetical protein
VDAVYPLPVRHSLLIALVAIASAAPDLRADVDLVVVTDANGRANVVATEVFLTATAGLAAFPSSTSNRELLSAALASGSGCPYLDIGCWRRVATLSGVGGAWVLVPAVDGSSGQLFHVDDKGDKFTQVLRDDAEGWRHAVQRLLGKEAALMISATPADATMTLDGGPVLSGITEGLSPGRHGLVAQAPGYERAELAVELLGGDAKNLQVTLNASGNNPTLFWAGAIMMAVGVAGQSLWIAQAGFPLPGTPCDGECRGVLGNNDDTANLLLIPTALVTVVGIAGIVMMIVSGGPE